MTFNIGDFQNRFKKRAEAVKSRSMPPVGGARDRKRKLLDKQKKGKARSKQFGRVEIPQEAFIGVLKINKEN